MEPDCDTRLLPETVTIVCYPEQAGISFHYGILSCYSFVSPMTGSYALTSSQVFNVSFVLQAWLAAFKSFGKV